MGSGPHEAGITKSKVYYVIHPLYDEPEEKRNPDLLAPMHLSKPAKCALLVLRVYLVAMVCIALYRVLSLA